MKTFYRFVSLFVGLVLLIIPFVFVRADNSVSVSAISPGESVPVGTKLTFTISSEGFANPSYGVADNTPNSTIAATNISAGTFTWTPTTADLGVHNLNVIVSDANGGSSGSATTPLKITVTPSAYATIKSLTPGTTVSTNQVVSFTTTPTGFSSPTFYVNDTHGTSTISNANIDADGNFKWVPSSQEIGEHVIAISIVDSSGRSAIVKQAIIVNSGATPTPTPTPAPSLTPIATPTPVSTTPIRIYPTQFSSGTVILKLNQTDSVTLSGGLANFYSINYNSNPSAVQASIDNNTLKVTGLNTGAAIVVACSAVNDCGAITVVVNTLNTGNSIAVVLPLLTPVATPVIPKSALTANLASALTSTLVSKFKTTLKFGMSSPEVTLLQKKLTALKIYSGPITGYFGSLTQIAVQDYQSSINLDPVGFVGPATRASLNK